MGLSLPIFPKDFEGVSLPCGFNFLEKKILCVFVDLLALSSSYFSNELLSFKGTHVEVIISL